jgi:hypothetical protein
MAQTTQVFQQATRRLHHAANLANQNPLSMPPDQDPAVVIAPNLFALTNSAKR